MRLALIALAIALAAPAAAAAAPGDVPRGRTLVVIGQSGVEPLDELGAATGSRPAGAMWYLNLFDDDIAGALAEIRSAVRERPGLVVQLGLSFGAISTPSRSHAAEIAAGRHDRNLARLAAFLNRLPTVAYLRVGYEFDLLRGQYGPPRLYKAAYRHVVGQLRRRGVDNASYVWHSAGAGWRSGDLSIFGDDAGLLAGVVEQLGLRIPRRTPPLRAFYPGRRYVDAFGISYWQDRCCLGRSRPAARRAYERRTRALLREARRLGLPLHVSESTPAYVGATSGRASVGWLDRLFGLVEQMDVSMLSLISIDWRTNAFFGLPFWHGYWADARVHAHPATCRRYVRGVTAGRYLHRTRRLGRLLAGGAGRIPAGPRPRGCAG